MTTIERSALLPYAAEQIFALVADIERYPEFLDGCVGAEILEQRDNTVTASLKLSRAGLSHGFTTRNTLHPPERMALMLVDGPFETFSGEWTFRALGESACKLRSDCSLSWPVGLPTQRQADCLTEWRLIWSMLLSREPTSN